MTHLPARYHFRSKNDNFELSLTCFRWIGAFSSVRTFFVTRTCTRKRIRKINERGKVSRRASSDKSYLLYRHDGPVDFRKRGNVPRRYWVHAYVYRGGTRSWLINFFFFFNIAIYRQRCVSVCRFGHVLLAGGPAVVDDETGRRWIVGTTSLREYLFSVHSRKWDKATGNSPRIESWTIIYSQFFYLHIVCIISIYIEYMYSKNIVWILMHGIGSSFTGSSLQYTFVNFGHKDLCFNWYFYFAKKYIRVR